MFDLFGQNQVFHAIPGDDVLGQTSEFRARTFACGCPNGFFIWLLATGFGFCSIQNLVECGSPHRVKAFGDFLGFVDIPISFRQNVGPRVQTFIETGSVDFDRQTGAVRSQ